MNEPTWLDYSGQTIDEIIAMAEERRIDSLVVAVEAGILQKIERGDEDVSDAELTVLAIEALEREVNNGGYYQFFSNSSRQFTQIAAARLDKIGCPESARITRDAISALHFADPAEIPDLSEEDDARDEALDSCDQRFYQSGEDIAGQLFAFIRANSQAIQI